VLLAAALVVSAAEGLEDWAAARRDAQAKIADYSIAATNESVVVGTLSGGNQQKIVVARELDRGCRMLIAAQPTRGVDIASADYIQGRILAAAEQGCAVLLISSDLDELIKVSDHGAVPRADHGICGCRQCHP